MAQHPTGAAVGPLVLALLIGAILASARWARGSDLANDPPPAISRVTRSASASCCSGRVSTCAFSSNPDRSPWREASLGRLSPSSPSNWLAGSSAWTPHFAARSPSVPPHLRCERNRCGPTPPTRQSRARLPRHRHRKPRRYGRRAGLRRLARCRHDVCTTPRHDRGRDPTRGGARRRRRPDARARN